MAFKSLRIAAVAILLLCLASGPGAAEPYRIVGFGDSLMAGYGLGPGEAFPDKLQAALRGKGHDVVIVNAGVSGDTTSGGLARLDWSIPDGTQAVILELGANDMLRGVAPGVTEENLDRMLARLGQRRMRVLLVGMLAAPNLGSDYAEAFNGIYERLAAKHGVALYPFFLDGVAAERSYLLEDGIHPNAAGVDRMVERLLPAMEKLLAADAGKT
ncbi:MAG: arylesterase [Mesorhizobium sp.]|jgi:acyl-CoA thioesterase-1